ncbi:MAG: response regulator [Planctomycetes bacterium]|nr:response regulator [Planctomycetota bacterium]
MTPPSELRLDARDFGTMAPFGFVVRNDRVIAVGGPLQRYGVRVGVAPDAVLTVLRPLGVLSFAELPLDATRMVLLGLRGHQLELKGHLVGIDDGDSRAFFGTAVAQSLEDFRRLGLQLGDFPPSDSTPDLLLAMQATRSALDDARAFSNDLQAALSDVQQAMEAKARFLAVMSHEIRTPLNGFGALIDLLREQQLDATSNKHLDTMDTCAKALLLLVNDVLDYSKLQAGHVTLNPRPFLVRRTMVDIAEHFRAAADAARLTLTIEVADDVPECALGDRDRIRQVLANLISNAIKFTATGGVTLRLRRLWDQHLVAEVRDTGTGIPAAAQASLFEPFTQADSSATRRHGGTGLGLTICREMARAMQGDVTLAESGPGGTCFRFEFVAPACAMTTGGAASRGETGPDDETALAGTRVLVAEDERTNQHIIEHLLRRLGCEPTIVANGALAVDAARGGAFDLVLMDLMMPELGGIDAAREIRALGGAWATTPIVACSAAAFDSDREAAAAAGMNGFLEKPLRLPTLRKELLAQRRAAAEEPVSAPRPGPAPTA